jgi:hypothetical protein
VGVERGPDQRYEAASTTAGPGRSASGHPHHLMLASQYAENLRLMVQEAGDLTGAGTWVDRAQVWAEQVGWPEMVAYTHVQRSALASSGAGDGSAAIEHAANALRVPSASTRIRGLAAKQVAGGHALLGHLDATKRAPGPGYVRHPPPRWRVRHPLPDPASASGQAPTRAATPSTRHACPGPTPRRGTPIGPAQTLGSWTTRIELRRALAPCSVGPSVRAWPRFATASPPWPEQACGLLVQPTRPAPQSTGSPGLLALSA